MGRASMVAGVGRSDGPIGETGLNLVPTRRQLYLQAECLKQPGMLESHLRAGFIAFSSINSLHSQNFFFELLTVDRLCSTCLALLKILLKIYDTFVVIFFCGRCRF